jgi:hypothetical protein
LRGDVVRFVVKAGGVVSPNAAAGDFSSAAQPYWSCSVCLVPRRPSLLGLDASTLALDLGL